MTVPVEHRLSQTRSVRGVLLADGFPPHPHRSPAGPRSGGRGGCGSDSPPPPQRTRSKPKSSPHEIPSVSTPQPPVPGPRTQLLVPLAPPPPPPSGARPGAVLPGTPAGRSVRPLTPAPESRATAGAGGSLRPPPRLRPGLRPPAERQTPPPPLPEPATQLRHTKPHRSAAAALCAPTRPGPAREAGGGGARREPVGSRRTGASAAPGSLTR